MSNWQPIETAPRDGTVIDIWVEEGHRVPNVAWRHHYWLNGKPQGGKSWGGGYDWREPSPTHWMPQPEAPEAAR